MLRPFKFFIFVCHVFNFYRYNSYFITSNVSFKRLDNLFINTFCIYLCINFLNPPNSFIDFNNRQRLILKCLKPLHQSFHIVIIPLIISSFLPPFCNPRYHSFLTTFQKKYKLHVNLSLHDFFPSFLILRIPWKPINQKLLLIPSMFHHSFFNQIDSYFNWDNFTIDDHLIN